MANVKATDLIDFTRASKGHALAKVSYGSELVENGTFDSDLSDWTDNVSKWSVSGSRAYHAPNLTFAVLRQSVPLTVGKVYRITFDYEVVQGQLRCQARDSSNQPNGDTLAIHDLTGTGSASVIFVPDSDYDSIGFARDDVGVTSEMYVDNVSVKEVLFSQADGTLQLFEHPNNTPRIEYDADGNLLGLLIEEARTNLFIHSEEIDSKITGTSGLLTPSDVVINEGVYQGTWRNFTEDTSNGQHRLLGGSTAISANTVYSISFLVKRTSGSRNVQVLAYNGGDSLISIFDLDAETATISNGGTGSAESGSVENLGSGVYKVSVSGKISTTATTTSFIIRLVDGASGSYAGDGTSSLAIKGMQLEAGSFPTSYIKTTGSTASRSADVASIDVDQFGYNQSEGTLFAIAKNIDGNTTDPKVVTLSDKTTSNRIRIDINDGNKIRMDVTDGGVTQTSRQSTFNDYDSQYKVAFAFKGNDFKLTLNNSVTLTDSSGTVPDGITSLYIGSSYNGAGGHINGHIKSLTYTPKRLSNAKLQELTS